MEKPRGQPRGYLLPDPVRPSVAGAGVRRTRGAVIGDVVVAGVPVHLDAGIQLPRVSAAVGAGSPIRPLETRFGGAGPDLSVTEHQLMPRHEEIFHVKVHELLVVQQSKV